MMRLYWRLRELVLRPPVAVVVISIGLGGGVAGFVYWYGPTFARYPLWQWPFVPDCPLFALLFTVSLSLILLGRDAPFYNALVAFGLIKYGTWTVMVWVLFWINTGGLFTPESVVMSISHLGMVLEGLFLLSFLKLNWATVVGCGAWFGLCDWMDYGPFQTYPHFDTRIVPLWMVQWHTIGMTVLLTAAYAYAAWRRARRSKSG